MDSTQQECAISYHEQPQNEYYKSRIPPNVPRKYFIEQVITHEISRLKTSDDTGIITKWMLNYMDETQDVPNHVLDLLNTSDCYLNVMENHIATLIQNARINLKNQKDMILQKIETRNKRIESRKKNHIRHTEKECTILKLVQRLPDDVIRYLSDFVFHPNIRLLFIQQGQLPIGQLLKTIKSPNLTYMIPSMKEIVFKFNTIVRSIHNMRGFIKYRPDRIDAVVLSITFVEKFTINKTATKEKKVEEYAKLFAAFQDIINYYEQFTTRSYKRLQNELIHLYHTVIYISKHKCNKRGKHSSKS
jgi:hypothetical protein